METSGLEGEFRQRPARHRRGDDRRGEEDPRRNRQQGCVRRDRVGAKGKPKGLPGDTVLVCEKLTTDDDGNAIDLGFVGDVTEVKVKLIKKEIARRFHSRDLSRRRRLRWQALQCERGSRGGARGECVARAPACLHERCPRTAVAPPDPESLISTLKTSQVDDLKKKGVIDKGMRPKVQSAIRAFEEGVQRVHFIDGRLAAFAAAGNFHRQGHRH